MKRYRDNAGRLTMTIDQIAAATLDGRTPTIRTAGATSTRAEPTPCAATQTRTHHGNAVEVAQFTSADGYNLFTDPARPGNISSLRGKRGQEITRFLRGATLC